GDEKRRHPGLEQGLDRVVGLLATQVHVDQGNVEPGGLPRGGQRTVQGTCAHGNLDAQVRQQFLQQRQQQELVLHHQGAHGSCLSTHEVSSASGMSIRQLTPATSNASTTSPSRSWRRPRSTRREPKPRRSGFTTGGPPLSRHSSCRRRAPSRSSTRQRIATWPSGTDSEPYFTALVHNSCSAMDSASEGRGARCTRGPSITKRSSPRPMP